jgi:uncharacterized membrane protein
VSELRTLAYVLLWSAAFCQAILLWLQLRAYAKYRHKSFAVLAVGTILGLALAAITLLVYLAPSTLPSPKDFYAVALVCGIAQVPLALVGVAWLFRSYDQLQSRVQDVLPNNALESTREG